MFRNQVSLLMTVARRKISKGKIIKMDQNLNLVDYNKLSHHGIMLYAYYIIQINTKLLFAAIKKKKIPYKNAQHLHLLSLIYQTYIIQ